MLSLRLSLCSVRAPPLRSLRLVLAVKMTTTKAPNFVGMVKVVVMAVEGAVPLLVAVVVSAVGFVVEGSTRAQ